MAGLFVFIILYVSACFCILHFDEPGALFEIGVLNLAGDAQEMPKTADYLFASDPAIKQEASRTTLVLWIFRGSMGVTGLSIVTSILCGLYANCCFATPTPNPPNALLHVNIPFNTLHQALTLGIGVAIVFNDRGVGGLFMSAVLLGFLLCHKKARKHVRLRMRQLIDRFTVGGNNSVEQIATIALAVSREFVENSVENSPARWAEPSVRYTVTLPEFLNDMDVTDVTNVTDVTDVSVTIPQVAQVENSPQRWAEPSYRYGVTLPEFINDMEVTDISL